MTFPITFGQVAGLLAVGVTILALAAFGVRDFLRDGRWWLVLLAGAVIVFGLVYDASLGTRAEPVLHAPAPLGLLVIQDIGGMK